MLPGHVSVCGFQAPINEREMIATVLDEPLGTFVKKS